MLLLILFFHNSEDENRYVARDLFLFEDRFLVAPLLTKGSVVRDV